MNLVAKFFHWLATGNLSSAFLEFSRTVKSSIFTESLDNSRSIKEIKRDTRPSGRIVEDGKIIKQCRFVFLGCPCLQIQIFKYVQGSEITFAPECTSYHVNLQQPKREFFKRVRLSARANLRDYSTNFHKISVIRFSTILQSIVGHF